MLYAWLSGMQLLPKWQRLQFLCSFPSLAASVAGRPSMILNPGNDYALLVGADSQHGR
jgi:hypothetical protein